MRIVSLVPSLTDTVCALGLRDDLVGVTGFCVRPSGLQRHTTKIGGTKDPDLAEIAKLKPTHILVNTEENKPEDIAACQAIGCRDLLRWTSAKRNHFGFHAKARKDVA